VVEVTHISVHGLWLLPPSGEVFLSFDTFPWFREATIGQLQNVKLLDEEHLYWADLDVDLTVDSIHNPEKYPLVSGPLSSKTHRQSAKAGKVSERSPSKRTRTRG